MFGTPGLLAHHRCSCIRLAWQRGRPRHGTCHSPIIETHPTGVDGAAAQGLGHAFLFPYLVSIGESEKSNTPVSACACVGARSQTFGGETSSALVVTCDNGKDTQGHLTHMARLRDMAHELKAETLSALRPRQGTKPALRGHSGFQTYEAINAATASGILWAGEACPSLAKTA